MRKQALLLLLLTVAILGLFPSSSVRSAVQTDASEEQRRAAIARILDDQQTAWNNGDVTGFMNGYWHSPEVTFAGSGGITRGWDSVLSRYKREYPDQTAMGQVNFSNVEVRLLGLDAALVLGQWHLHRNSGDIGGVFSLVFQRLPAGWRIVHDHTSLVQAKTD